MIQKQLSFSIQYLMIMISDDPSWVKLQLHKKMEQIQIFETNQLCSFISLYSEQIGSEVVVLLTDTISSKCTFVHRQLSLSQIDGYFISLLSFQTMARWSVPFRDFSGMAGKVVFLLDHFFICKLIYIKKSASIYYLIVDVKKQHDGSKIFQKFSRHSFWKKMLRNK